MSIYNKLDLTGWKPEQLTPEQVRFATWIAFFAWVFAVYDFILFGTLLPEIGRHFSWSEVEQAEIATWVAVGTAVVALAIGPLVDRLGRRVGIMFTVSGSAICSALTAIGGSWGKSPLILIRSLGGLGYAEETVNATYLSEIYAASDDPRLAKRRGFIYSLVQGGWPVGALIAAGLTAVLLPIIGWQGCFVFAAIPAIIIAIMARKLKVVVDCGNGAAGVIAPQLIEALGCEVISLFAEVDGNFPNHLPDPGKLENLQDLIAKVNETGADLGLAFDGDGDRVGVVTNKGNVVYPDRLLMLFALDVLKRNPGADIVFDVKCTRRLTPLISEHGGRPVTWKTGHSLIKKEMKKSGALLAGEMSGHIFFKERWFGFDDGIYSAARLLEILSQESTSAEDLFETFPNDISTPEINIKVTDVTKFSIIEALEKDAQWGDAKLTSIDGVRVDYPKGWGLVRASNTTPVLVLRFEAETEAELQRIKDVFHAELKKVAPDLDLPF